MPAPASFPLRLVLYLAMAATVALAIHMARPWGGNEAYRDFAAYARLGAFLLWAVSPLAALAWAAGRFRHPPIAGWTFATGTACIVLAGLYVHVDATLVHPDAQGGLAFVFVPLVQWFAALCLGVVCAVLRRVGR